MKDWKKNISSYFSRPRRLGLTYALATFIGLLFLWGYANNLIESRFDIIERQQITSQVDRLGTSLTLAINQKLGLVTSLRAFIEAEATHDASHSEFEHELEIFSAGLLENANGVRNIAIGPDGVKQFVYPYEENKSVLGYEPAKDTRAHVVAEVQRAIESRKVILSLPYELIQGGLGIIARQAIFMDENYWGLANIVVD